MLERLCLSPTRVFALLTWLSNYRAGGFAYVTASCSGSRADKTEAGLPKLLVLESLTGMRPLGLEARGLSLISDNITANDTSDRSSIRTHAYPRAKAETPTLTSQARVLFYRTGEGCFKQCSHCPPTRSLGGVEEMPRAYLHQSEAQVGLV
ncbi:hypothetical protein GGR52DRAFT_312994 [Hypoxylon sp. FL1284]|nr:hypothetical protein GGR52DRAFT_312994 [Hypoxylon sp. FL1284]